jgi:hypothetical protein
MNANGSASCREETGIGIKRRRRTKVHEDRSASPTCAKADIDVERAESRARSMHAKAKASVSALAICDRSCVRNAGFVLAIADPRDIAVNTEPPGAVCDLIQANLVIATVNPTPGSAHVASTLPDITFVCRHTGFHQAIYFREWSVGNIVVGGRLGRAVDEMLGVDYAAPVNIAMRNLTPAEAEAIGEDAYIYGYSLLTMDLTRQVATNVAAPQGLRAPVSQFAKAREYPTAADRDVTAPDTDTLYSSAWLDLSKEPYILSLPDEGDRYYLMPMLSGWTEVFQVPGKRTTGDKAQTYAITGPGWTGTLPAGVTQYKSPTNLVWIIGRTYCTGMPEDYKAVHAIQDQYKLVPLSAYGKPYTPLPGKVDPGIDMKTPVRDQINRMDAATYFKRLASLMKDNPPASEDASIRRQDGQDRHRSGSGLRHAQTRPGRRRGPANCAKTGGRTDNGSFEGRGDRRERLGCHHQDRALWHRLSTAGPDHRHRSRRQPSAGCGLCRGRGGPGRQTSERRQQQQIRDALRER